MKKFGLLLFAAALLVACDDNDGDYAAYRDIVTVRRTAGSGLYFEMNNAKKLYPGDRSRIEGYDAEDGQRAILWFNLLPDAVAGYDYNVAAYYIEDIYTAEARIVTPEELDALPDDAVTLRDAELTAKHLTLMVAYPVTDNQSHDFELVRAEPAAEDTPTHAGYLDVELRHDAGGDTGPYREYYISFPLDELQEAMEGMSGLTLRVKTDRDRIIYQQIKR